MGREECFVYLAKRSGETNSLKVSMARVSSGWKNILLKSSSTHWARGVELFANCVVDILRGNA